MLDPCNDMFINYLVHVHRYPLHNAIDEHDLVHGDGAVVAHQHDLFLNKNQPNIGFSIQVGTSLLAFCPILS